MNPLIPGSQPSDGGRRNMILILGAPFTGKSTAAGTFPNPVFLDFDHKAPAGKTIVPFWDDAFCDKYKKRYATTATANRSGALIAYLSTELRNFPKDCTIILDSMTAVEAAFHHQIEKVEPLPISPKSGKPDAFYVWKEKLAFFGGLLSVLKTYAGNVIVIMHEQYERDEDGKLTSTIKPLMSGSFVDSIAAHFTSIFRQRIETVPNKPAAYVWDVLPTKAYPCNNALGITTPVLPATYESLIRFIQPPVQTSQQISASDKVA